MYLTAEHSSAAPIMSQTEASGNDDYMALNILNGLSIVALYRVGDTSHAATSATDLFSRDSWNQGMGIFSSSSKRSGYVSGSLVSTNTDGADISGLSRTGIGGLAFDTPPNPAVIDTNTRIAEVALWKAELATWELGSLGRGVRPSFIRPTALKFYVPLVNDVIDEQVFLTLQQYDDDVLSSEAIEYAGHPDMVDAVEVAYPIEQDGFDANSVDTTIADYRTTRLNNYVYDTETSSVKWEFSLGGDTFIHTTTATSGSSGSVLGSSLNQLDLWLPPGQQFTVRTKPIISGVATTWTPTVTLTSLGYINSYQKGQILNRGTTISF